MDATVDHVAGWISLIGSQLNPNIRIVFVGILLLKKADNQTEYS